MVTPSVSSPTTSKGGCGVFFTTSKEQMKIWDNKSGTSGKVFIEGSHPGGLKHVALTGCAATTVPGEWHLRRTSGKFATKCARGAAEKALQQ
jgi:hypothetical protein